LTTPAAAWKANNRRKAVNERTVAMSGMTHYLWIAVCSTILAVAPSCSDSGEKEPGGKQSQAVSAEDLRKETREAYETAKGYSAAQMEDFQKEISKEVESYDRKIAKLKSRVERMQGDAKKEMQEKIRDLEEKRAQAADRLKQLKEAGGEAWSEMKTGMDRALDALQEAYDRAVSEFEEKSS
jgi:TolA-binding protein